MTTKSEVERWLDERKDKHTHMLVVVDTMNFKSFPIFVSEGQKVKEIMEGYNHDFNDVHEVYNLGENLSDQILQIKAWNV